MKCDRRVKEQLKKLAGRMWEKRLYIPRDTHVRSVYPSPTLRFVPTIRFMARWLAPRSEVGRLVIQLVVVAVVAGGVYLLVLMLGSGLRGSTLQLSDARWG